MKSIAFAALALLSFNSFALENGSYINKDFSNGDPGMYQSMELDSSSCPNGGFIVKLHNADPMNFCVGFKDRSVFKYKKCVGKELYQPPFFSACLGINRTASIIQEKEVSLEEGNALALNQRDINDKVLYFEQQFKLIDAGEGKVKLIHSFISHDDGRSGTNEVLFEKK